MVAQGEGCVETIRTETASNNSLRMGIHVH